MMMLLMNFILFLNLLMINSPIIMLMNILLISLNLAWLISLLYSSWYSFMIFLIYVGGMLIMFSYFVALNPNQYLKMKSMMYFFISMSIILLILFKLFFNKELFSNSYNYMIDILYTTDFLPLLIYLILILLIMMLLVSKLVSFSKGPLRPFNYV
uniref:NADH dehydrogenase subunit 6 n=1 Tax=Dinobdella ferox TaxID=755736 RepID=UPI0023D7E41C|nr:NADH dehydrogenase subunit 6 [Dinobdella ferox]WDA96089.1 NADH dehydrogenase subunit 6 [Dinobdella ferox]